MSSGAYKVNIEQKALKNKYFRNVLETTKDLQIVVMSIPVGGEIAAERHKRATQFIRVERGHATVHVNKRVFRLKNGDAITIPAGALHRVVNSGKGALQVYTIYSRPQHRAGTKEKTA